MGAFHIEDDWYIVPDQYSWNVAKYNGADKRTGRPMYEYLAYCTELEDALMFYLKLKQRETAVEAPDSEISELVGILKGEKERLASRLRRVFSEACEVELKKPHSEDSEE